MISKYNAAHLGFLTKLWLFSENLNNINEMALQGFVDIDGVNTLRKKTGVVALCI